MLPLQLLFGEKNKTSWKFYVCKEKKKLINSSIKKKKKEKQENEYGYNKSLPDGVDFTLIVIIVTS